MVYLSYHIMCSFLRLSSLSVLTLILVLSLIKVRRQSYHQWYEERWFKQLRLAQSLDIFSYLNFPGTICGLQVTVKTFKLKLERFPWRKLDFWICNNKCSSCYRIQNVQLWSWYLKRVPGCNSRLQSHLEIALFKVRCISSSIFTYLKGDKIGCRIGCKISFRIGRYLIKSDNIWSWHLWGTILYFRKLNVICISNFLQH